MTALALTNSTPTPKARTSSPKAIDWSRWVSADEAARILGDHPGTLKRKCKALQKRGDAMFRRDAEDKGNARWWISRSYDLRLAPGKAGESYQAPDLSAYSEKQTNLAMQRAACVKRLWFARASEKRPQKVWLPQLIKDLQGEHPDLRISRSTLFTWHAQYRDPADLVKLIDTRGGNTRGEPDPICWDIFRQLYLTEHKRTRKSCWKRVRQKAKADGLIWCSYPQLLRLVRNRLSPAERCKHRDPDKYRSKHSDYQNMDPDTWAPGECWQGDHSVLDMWCEYEGKPIRPWITAWMDWRTRKIVGWVLCASPNSSTILAAFARAIRDPLNQGGPDTVYIDNGKDYAAEMYVGETKKQRRKRLRELFKKKKVFSGEDYDLPAFRGLYGMLSIGVIFALPYNSRAKGRIERWFGYSLHEEHDKYYPTYAGRSPETRPSGLTETLKAGKDIPTFEQVRVRLGEHITRYNCSCEHNKEDLDGLSPDETMALARRRVFGDPGVLDRFMLTYSKPVRVRRHRVTVNVLGAKGLVYKSDDGAFADLNGREAYYRVGYDQDDVRTATLFDEQMRPVCHLYQADFGRHATTPVGREHLSRAMSRQRRLNTAKKIVTDAKLVPVLSTEDIALYEAGKNPKDDTRSEPPTPNALPTRLVHTPVDGHLNKLQCLDMKQAAGGEFTPGSEEDQPRRRMADPSDFMADLDGSLHFDAAADAGQDHSGDDDLFGEEGFDASDTSVGGDGPIDLSAYLDDDFNLNEPTPSVDVHDFAPEKEGGAW